MEDTLQRVFSAIFAVVILFLLPLYIALEKVDDVSYSLALKITSNFVDNVKNKGYLSKEMYDNYIANLAVTGNDYDISLEHISKKYYPVIYSYTDNTYKEIKATFDYNLYKNAYEDASLNGGKMVINSVEYDNLILAYDLSEVRNTKNQILNFLESNVDYSTGTNIYEINNNKAIYPMSTGDEFTVIIKNTNVTIATILFNTLTLGANADNTTKIYINYGGTILNEEYNSAVLEAQVTSQIDSIKYEKQDMKLWFDGYYNTLQGEDKLSNIWEDLSQNNNSGQVSIKNIASVSELWNFGDGYLKIDNLNSKQTYVNCGTLDEILDVDKDLIQDTEFTIECTFLPMDSSTYQYVFSDMEDGGFGFRANTSEMRFVYKTEDNAAYDELNGTNQYTSTQLVGVDTSKVSTVTFVYDTQKATIYYNGVENIVIDGKLHLASVNSELVIGTNKGYTSIDSSIDWFTGRVYSLRVYSRALDQDEIVNNYDIDHSRFGE